MKKADVNIGYRAAEEVSRLVSEKYGTLKNLFRRMNLMYKLYYNWQCGDTPDGRSLAKLLDAGADVVYILSGRRFEA